ncbi:DUF948 domain-containing protein [Kocuria palustris]|uniref:DUF948 domain-containing protein n=1 Tax=Kocuria palustris TaxID=71999 RepID=UPI0011A55756
MTGGDVAGLIAAGVFAVLVALMAVPLLKLGRVFDELRVLIRDLNDETEPLLEEVTRTVATTNTQLEKVDVITDSVSDASANMSAMTSLVASTVGQPIIKTAAFSSGVRRAFSGDAVRARREERRRAREAEERAAASSAGAPEEAPGDSRLDGDVPAAEQAPAPSASPERQDPPKRTAAEGSSAAAQTRSEPSDDGSDGPWWKGTEWDTEPGGPATDAADPAEGRGA